MHEAIAATAQGELLASNPKLKPLLVSLGTLARELAGGGEEDDVSVPASSGGSLLSRLRGKK
jgi:hypothetical protein